MMVNYRYEISKIEDRHDAYAHEGVIDAHDNVKALLVSRTVD
jgi:hypothetical protein